MIATLVAKLVREHTLSLDEYAALIDARTSALADELAGRARETCEAAYGDAVFARGLIEFTNVCKNDCYYCGIRRSNRACERYRLAPEQILACADAGWQAGFRTDRAYTKARITRLETERISSELERNRVVVVAGFQGLNKLDDITTLGRGGSDTSAVAIAAALHADRCQIYTDVEGVYTADPRKVSNTRKLEEITFDEMLELASLGAQVLNNRSVELAKKYNVELEVLSSLNPVPGTVVKEVTKDMEGMLIKGVAKDTDVAVITILNVPDEPGTSFKIFGLLAQKNINVDIILQSTGRDGKKDISFTCSEGEADLAMRVLKESAHFNDVSVDTTCAKVSIVGAGMQSHSGVASKMFEALSNNNINIKMISTSEIKISCIIARDDADKAVSAIHDMLFD